MPPSKHLPTLSAADSAPTHPATRPTTFLQITLTALGYLNTKFDHLEDHFTHAAPNPKSQSHTAH